MLVLVPSSCSGFMYTPTNERWALSTTRVQDNLHRKRGRRGGGGGVCGGIREQEREGGGKEWGRWREGRGKEERKGEKSEVVEGVSDGY